MLDWTTFIYVPFIIVIFLYQMFVIISFPIKCNFSSTANFGETHLEKLEDIVGALPDRMAKNQWSAQ